MVKNFAPKTKWFFWRTQKNDMPPWGGIARRWGNTINTEFYKLMGLYIGSVIIWKKGQVWSYFNKKDLEKFDKIFFKKMINKSDFIDTIRQKHFTRLKNVLVQAKKINRQNLRLKSNQELYKLFREFRLMYSSTVTYTILAMFFQFGLEKYTRNYIKQQAEKFDDVIKINDYFNVLSSFYGKSWSIIEEEALYRVAIQINKNKNLVRIFLNNPPRKIIKLLKDFPIFFNLVEKHYQSYCWIPYKYFGPAWTKTFFLRRLKSMLSDLNQNKKRVKKYSNQELKKKKQQVIKELHIDYKHQKIFSTIAELIYLKEYRNGMWCRIQYEIAPFIKELQRRFKLTFLQVHYMTFTEWENVLKNENISSKFIKELDQRYKFSVWYGGGGQEKFLVGKKANDFVKKEIGVIAKSPIKKITSLHGSVAQAGDTVIGQAKVILNSRDIFKVNKNDILIAPMTNQDYFIGMQKAKAIVTDAGGIVCHAAILARELKIPCIVGTKYATKIFKTGDLIEVNTKEGIINKKIGGLVARQVRL